MKTTWSVIIVTEDDEHRKEAVKFCDALVERFWADNEFDLTWSSFREVCDEPAARELASKAAQADIVLFACGASSELPSAVETWMEGWAAQRGDREGSIVALSEPTVPASRKLPEKFVFLRNLAHRAGMDYLTRMPQEMRRSLPDSLDSYTARAHQMTGTLDEIMKRKTPPRLFH
jgi:hypothetical protein